MYNCLDRIWACDRRTDRQTLVRAMHTHHVAKIEENNKLDIVQQRGVIYCHCSQFILILVKT